ncbi:sensor histidine kinase [Archangium sp.]|uniref:sensor histidine kinase n=1 Tax=Archangium sp. TaxID=1872627 RepID=UPI002D4E9D93|nr:ATP-binding protein [Archangium sp.]HYO58930.1 ATP-binding protein [Archangium sp.]
MVRHDPPAGQVRLRLCDFIRSHFSAILEAWECLVRALPVASPLSAPRLINHMPEVLERIAAVTETSHTRERASLDGMPEVHALDRLDGGFDLGAVATEYSLLRKCVLRLYREENAAEVPLEEVERFNEAIDEAVRLSVARYAEARGRTLIALDRISEAALESSDVERFLPRLLEVLLETTASVDLAIVMLCEEEGILRVKAAVGTGENELASFCSRVGKGFVGKVAAERRPLECRELGARALYGVPLMEAGTLIGVTMVGSRTALEFSVEDKLLIRTMANRATALISRAQLAAQERAARREAQQARSRLESIVQQMPAGVVIAEAPSGRLLLGNAEFERIWGQPFLAASSIHEYRVYRGFHPEGHPYAPEDWPLSRALLKGETVAGEEIIIERGDGTRRYTLQNATPVLGSEGAVQCGVVTALDITERKLAEEELRRAAEFRERFLGIVSHDLRNPLNAILASASFLRDDENLSDRQMRTVHRIVRSAERMARMIEELLDFTRGRLGGGIPLTPRPTNLRHLCRHVLEELESSHPGRELRLEAPGNFQGEWDPDRLAQVLVNLGKNALDYSPEGTPVEFTLHDEGDTLRVVVHNKGAPIPAEQLPRIFEPFRRATLDEGHPACGLGLGLFIVQQIVHAHGGTIEVRSTEADGTTFTVRLPRRPVSR